MTSPFTSNNACPVCSGHRTLRRGQGVRCFGFLSDNGRYAHCTREEHANGLPFESESQTFAHFLEGECRCGRVHGNAPPTAPARRRRKPAQGEPPKARDASWDRIEAVYEYTDERGAVQYGVDRLREPKDFRQWTPRAGYVDGVYGLNGATPTLYHLPALLAGLANGARVYIPEGEKDVESAEAAGAVATCNSGGGGKWRDDFASYFGGATVVVIRDLDDDGRGQRHAHQIIDSLLPVAASVQLVEARDGKDVTDHLAAGYTLDELREVPIPDRSEDQTRKAFALPWRTAPELAAETPEEPEWIACPYFALGVITELEAKVKLGKTTFLAYMVAAVRRGALFLGQPTQTTAVVWLTEESTQTFRAVLDRARLLEDEGVHVLTYGQVRDHEWESLMEDVIADAQAKGAGLLIVDTLPQWTGIDGDDENKAGAALKAIAPLRVAADAGLAVIVVRHGRKSGGDIADSGRGSSAFAGAVDILLSLRRVHGQGHDSRRSLEAVGRLDGIPPNLVIELVDREYVAVGDSANVTALDVRRAMLDFLPASRDDAMLIDEIRDRLRDIGGRTTIQRALGSLEADGLTTSALGFGRGGRARGYWQIEPDDEPGSPPEGGESHSLPIYRERGGQSVRLLTESSPSVESGGKPSAPPAAAHSLPNPPSPSGQSVRSTCSTDCGEPAPVGGKCHSCAVRAIEERFWTITTTSA